MGDIPVEDLPYAYLTTTGRVTGAPHRIEIWFARADDTVFLLAGDGDRSDWVRNLVASPSVVLEVGDRTLTTTARVVERGTDEDATARRALLEKYQPGSSDDLGTWATTALAVAVDWTS
ncbi:MAG TPA: nitroreductase/quinone reductase family protein [Actinomycetota bacterium]|nr:nitroreductase/quinone reductase family protein [Actinomycetota bacterium]